jgi:mycofactocin precursor
VARTTPAVEEALMNPEQEHQNDELVAEDLIEEVSIDGMCGVY